MDIDLDRHAVIEASAGTGKTHAIEELVLRLIRTGKASLEEILVVTFTEKATGELKARLRSALEKSSLAAAEDDEGLRQALDHFDQAPIFTIHGFCQRLLSDYPLEKGHDAGARLVQDADWLNEALREVQRHGWRRQFGARLPQVLAWANYEGQSAAAWEALVGEVSRRFRPAFGHRLVPDPPTGWDALLAEAEPPPEFDKLLASWTIQEMHTCLDALKRRRNGMSFDDMLVRVKEALEPQHNRAAPRLLKLLRARYRYAIVDEFQDTDPIQWDIFRRIFLEGETTRLFVVGDAKQAIYAFRGADLPTYQRAVCEMTSRFGAQTAPLEVNWRSVPQLLNGLNAVFGDGNFFCGDEGISYHKVRSPQPEVRQVRVQEDTTGRKALVVVDLNGCPTAVSARRRYADFVAEEMVELLAGTPGRERLTLQLKNQPARSLEAGDIGILVFRRKEADPLIEALNRARIPWTFYKEGSLWKSDEAQQVRLVLETLARPDEAPSFRLALLTEFFGLRPGDLTRAGEIPTAYTGRELFQRWAAWAQEQQWASLFASLLEDTGLLCPGRDVALAERSLANYRAIFSTLQETAYGDNLDLPALTAWLRGKIDTAPDEDQQPIETQQPKVTILTIHASKGLEYPVLFLAGGFTTGGREKTVVYRGDDDEVVFDLTRAGKPRMQAERVAETRRLLYVALTRAMVKLYVPCLEQTKKIKAAPVTSLLTPALRQGLNETTGAATWISADATGADRPSRVLSPATPRHAPAPPPPAISLDPQWARRRLVVRSFSSLRRRAETAPQFGDPEPRHLDEPAEALLPPDGLRGVVFGHLVHEVLEKIDFAAVGQTRAAQDLLAAGGAVRAELEQAVRRALPKFQTRTPRSQLESACLHQVATLVWHALHTPLKEVGGPLWRVPREERLHELQFHYPELRSAPAAASEEIFITGLMDLVVRANGRWFLIDWKTNWLTDYTQHELGRCMRDSDYHSQYRLYLEALRRWLERRPGPRSAQAQEVGGVYYLFVRGLNGQDESRGVFFDRPGNA